MAALEEGSDAATAAAADAAADEELLKDALLHGTDLREYAKQVEDELKSVESASIDDYLREDENLKNLHKDIRSCDQILEQMQKMLGGFQQVEASRATFDKFLPNGISPFVFVLATPLRRPTLEPLSAGPVRDQLRDPWLAVTFHVAERQAQ